MPNFQLGGLISESSLRQTPQDSLTNCEADYTSIFGTFSTNSILRGIPVMASNENLSTPFTKEAMMRNIFVEDYSANDNFNCMEDDDEIVSNLEFEC